MRPRTAGSRGHVFRLFTSAGAGLGAIVHRARLRMLAATQAPTNLTPTEPQIQTGSATTSATPAPALVSAGVDAGVEQRRREKQRAKKEERRRLQSLIGRPRKCKEATTKPSARQRDAQTATRATGNKPKLAGGVAQAVNTVHRNYKFAIRQNSQITLKFS